MAFTSKLAGLAIFAPALMVAAISGPPVINANNCPGADVCNYSITGTGLDTSNNLPTEDITQTWNLSFSFLGPEIFNAAPNTLLSFAVTGTPASGWVYDNNRSGLTSYGSDGAALVTFDDTNSATDGLNLRSVSYTFYGTDAFWAQAGGPFNFGATEAPGAVSGAFYTFQSNTISEDPPCSACTVTNTVTPEPGSLGFLAAAIGLCLVPFRKKLRKRAE